jgi:Lar family restriction alleviation protein
MTLELKPCPFCGMVEIEPEVITVNGVYHIACYVCGASSAWRNTPERAAESWNNRPEIEALRQRVAELEARETTLHGALESAVETIDGYRWQSLDLGSRGEIKRLSDDDVFAHNAGSPLVDDPPNGWGREQLAQFLRGQMYGEAMVAGNLSGLRRTLDRLFGAPQDTPDTCTPIAPDPTPNGCNCAECNPGAWWMLSCSRCGNKRCPGAESHRYGCQNSNEPGQVPELEAV